MQTHISSFPLAGCLAALCIADLSSAQATQFSYDDGTTENALSMNASFIPGEVAMIHAFDSGAGGIVNEMQVAIGTALAPAGALDGKPLTLAVWGDPNQDGNPNDAALLWSSTGLTVSMSNSDTKVAYPVPNIPVSGVFFVGAVTEDLGDFPVGLDFSNPTDAPNAWLTGEGPGTSLDLTNLGGANFGLSSSTTHVFLLGASVDLGGTLGTPYCFGDGSGLICPCGNNGASGEGCANSMGIGALLEGSGNATVGADSLVLEVTQARAGQSGLFFQAVNSINGGQGVAFGDGLRCAGGSVIRLEVLNADASGAAQTSVSISSAGGVSAGDTRYYQFWYRDPAGSPCGAGFNLSNGLQVDWN